MSLKSFLLKKLGIKDRMLFFYYLSAMTVFTEISLSLPVPDPVSAAISINGLTSVSYLVLRQKK